MSSYVKQNTEHLPAVSSFALMEEISKVDFSACSATVVGYGFIGKQHVKALRALGVRRTRVCSRSAASLRELRGVAGVEIVEGGFEALDCSPHAQELGIVATPTELLVPAARHMATLGFRSLLIEKPVSLWSKEIQGLAEELELQGVDAVCGYNRVAYPSFHEVRSRTYEEGGITSCTYTLTELIKPDWVERYPAQELARWGVSNSSHVMSMAHGLIGLPQTWEGHHSGVLPWHTSGSVFVGSGVSDRAVPFAYHADWGSTGRWSVELHTPISSYRLCPLETVLRRTSAFSDWEEVPIATAYPGLKAGIAEEIAAMLSQDTRKLVSQFSLVDSAELIRFGEALFGYETAC